MRLNKLVDVSVGHPFGYHHEVATFHLLGVPRRHEAATVHHSQQREHIRMAKAFPQYNLFIEPLRNCGQLLATHFWQTIGGNPLR